MRLMRSALQASEVAEARLQQAVASMAHKKNMMEKIDFGTAQLKLFVNVGYSIAEVSFRL